ncbi:hypothetical protein BDV34DRAFT_197225 [Aspergillus parasiticus]|uniref:SNF2 N-terminal domain-containing protein n=1 Tax=Aspergillus parasiticus TaxID=5067 RepID=A0A5N6DH66_ASPPA|nr:hypothetical protein BDV34DRAFT_197225 [Aspergillus parasiticus]
MVSLIQFVLTTYNTLEARHGVSAATQWHKDKYSRNYQPGDTLPDDFPGSLKGCFGLVICDEAQYVRNEGSGISLSVWWLQSDFNLLMMGTPFFNNRNRDTLGYSKLLLLDYPAPENLSAERLSEIVKGVASTDSNIILSRNIFQR